MSKLEKKRVEWLYAHFQGISQSSDRLLVLFAVLVVSAMAVWLSDDKSVELPFIKVSAGREVLLGCLILSGAFTLVAFFGNYDMGEQTVAELARACECKYEEMWFVDTHPTLVDFAKFRRPEARARRLPARFCAALLYPIALLSALLYLSVLWAYEVFMKDMTTVEIVAFALALPPLWVAWDRGREYLVRRWRTFWQNERAAAPVRPAA